MKYLRSHGSLFATRKLIVILVFVFTHEVFAIRIFRFNIIEISMFTCFIVTQIIPKV
uniref:Uncharacterized protein n=1 Tax=Arundo donax TaxID=35708 RepID=A0A0A9F8N2_ARUDO